MIINDKAPYLLTILFASFAWTISQISIDITSSPVIEVTEERKTEKNDTVIYTISNLSRDKLFKNLHFIIRIEENNAGKILNAKSPVIPPPYEPYDNKEERVEPTSTELKTEYANLQLHPGAAIQFEIFVSKDTLLNLYVKSESPVRILSSSWETKLIKYRFHILTAIFGIWLVLIILYITIYYCLSRENR